MRARTTFRRAVGPAGVAIMGLLAIALGAAIKTGYIGVEHGSAARDSSGVTVRTTAGEVELPGPRVVNPPGQAPPETPAPLRDADTVPVQTAPRDTNAVRPTAAELTELSDALVVPVAGVQPKDLLDTFDEPRGTRKHNALDIPAPRGTPIVSATDGRVRRLFTSAAGGLMVYASDRSDRFILMYAHLDRYADGLTDTTTLRRGDTIGFVGTTGNAPPNVPHLHFAIARTRDVKRWWSGTPVDPRALLRR
jgi:murein DD-endopeptidase MepM/ murein hydrolase activator NlpD